MTKVRHPAVAGTFYPGEPRVLKEMVDGFLGEPPADAGAPHAIIAPHAGYIYSGPVAGSAYAALKPVRESIKRVVLLGPSHYVPFRGLATSGADEFLTPLGAVPIDKAAVNKLLELPFVATLDAAHEQEHSLEVHLPFLQETLEAFSLVPLVAGEADPGEVETVIDLLWDGNSTLFVISSDLSHYHDYTTARAMDAATSKAIEELRPEDISYDQACGRIPITGLLSYARKHGLRARTVDLRNSGDTAGPRDRVVGYGAYVFT